MKRSSTSKHKKTGRLDASFKAKLVKSPKPGGWLYVYWPKSVAFLVRAAS